MISVQEKIRVPSPPARVWEVVSDPAEVVSCISGAELGEAHDDGSFDGTLVVKFGAVRVRFAARVSLELAPSDLEGRLEARGRDGQRATRFTAHATFRIVEGDGPDDSRVLMDGEIQLTGKLASLVEAGAGAVVSRMTKDFSQRLVLLCAEPAATPAKAPTRPRALGRLRAWWARLFTRRRPRSQERTATESKETGSGSVQAQ
ncbi:carbon monoxide dehydrogenase [Actinomadura darangshiensis]|uniref:Carbon monoxide dehydrogenase n=1 Tax=Actinomadura darangshiensis TaxID=705336 RepID=A0A4V2YW81_9ACTN|nr:SRPBCC domain-containing protein [Actinomadura darangshiensis]TDD84377.1 carbon monoxide dehydrogenase [Actinomadura darangshiensis]